MKIFFSEYKTDYSSYTFSYAIYCIKEQQSELDEIYDKGFLPYTGNFNIENDTFYLARSLRVNLKHFESSSENRRVNRKATPLNIKMEIHTKETFDLENPEFQEFCQAYAEERFSGGNMESKRLEYVLKREMLTHIISFRSDEQVFGYVFTVLEKGILHYWFSFYDTQYMRSHSLGKWMMWKVIDWAKEQGLQYVYIGTCYREKSLYKVRDHKGAEFFDGQKWNQDITLLKSLCKADDQEKNTDLFKLAPGIYDE